LEPNNIGSHIITGIISITIKSKRRISKNDMGATIIKEFGEDKSHVDPKQNAKQPIRLGI
jgi:hypothetical protein